MTSIGNYAFYSCSSLASIEIPNSVTSIGEYAFRECSSLASVIIGTGVLSIGNNAFSSPKKVIWLTNTPPSGYTNAKGSVNYVANEQYISLSNKTVYPFLSSIFEVGGVKYVPVSPSERTCDIIDCAYNESAENININNTVENMGISLTVQTMNPYALYGNTYIKSVKIDFDGDISNYAFYGCTALETVEIHNTGNIGTCAFANIAGSYMANINNMGAINGSAFINSTGLTSLNIGGNVTNIDSDAFYGCTGLKNIQLNNHGTIGANAYQNCSALETVTLGERITYLEDNVFRGCSMLQNIVVPDSVQSLGSYAFSGCERLKSAKIGEGIQDIKAYTFSDCSSLTDIQIGNNVGTIDNYAFNNCSSLTGISIPQSVTKINNYVFHGCSSLANVILEDVIKEEQEDEAALIQFPDWTSANHSHSSTSFKEYTFSVVFGGYLSFNYSVDSESGYDKLIVKINGTTVLEESGKKTGSYRYEFTENGEVTLYLSYTKDNSTSSGTDQVSVTEIWLNGGSVNGVLTIGSNDSNPLFADCPLNTG